jgi:hypothetical protein
MGVCVPQLPAGGRMGNASDAPNREVLLSDAYKTEQQDGGSNGHQLSSESDYEQPSHAPLVNIHRWRHTTGSGEDPDHISAASTDEREEVRGPTT